jgi:polysaccharide export outer membrane protein
LTLLLLWSIAFFKPGDVVQVKIWRHPDLSDTFYVDQDTLIDFPLIGAIKVSNLDQETLEDTLRAKYSLYIKQPHVTVTKLIKVSILGEVRKPGVYYLKNTDQILEALAMAGGATDKANLKKAKLRRGGEILRINLREAIEKGKTVTDVGLQSGDILYVPRTFFVSWRDWYYLVSTVALGWSIYKTFKK